MNYLKKKFITPYAAKSRKQRRKDEDDDDPFGDAYIPPHPSLIGKVLLFLNQVQVQVQVHFLWRAKILSYQSVD